MLERMIALKMPVLQVLTEEQKEKEIIADNEWIRIQDLVILLGPFEEATKILSKQTVTISVIQTVVSELFGFLSQFKSTSNTITTTAQDINLDMASRWHTPSLILE